MANIYCYALFEESPKAFRGDLIINIVRPGLMDGQMGHTPLTVTTARAPVVPKIIFIGTFNLYNSYFCKQRGSMLILVFWLGEVENKVQ